jgi:hypothetical protein
VALESVDEPIEPVALFGFACAVPLTPDEFMLPLALVSPDRVVPLAVALLFGLLAAVPAVDWVPSTDPCWVVPVLLAVFVSLFVLEHAAIRAAAAIAVPTLTFMWPPQALGTRRMPRGDAAVANPAGYAG